MNKILISSCFLGQPVRYDGKSKPLLHAMIEQWQQECRLIAICPEVSGGLSVPRQPAELNIATQQVITSQGVDVTSPFRKGAELALALCQKHQIRYALLKESSPSCGSNKVYDGNFTNTKIPGKGITAQLLTEHNIQVFSEDTIDKLIKQLN